MGPIIGIPLRSEVDEKGRFIEYLAEPNRRVFVKLGAEVLAIAPVQDINYYEVKAKDFPELTLKEKEKIDYWLDFIDGLYIPGGIKFCPYDRYLLDRAIEMKIPVLGVCLGMQLMSCYQRDVKLGDLDDSQISRHFSDDIINGSLHKVFIDKDSKLYEILGKEEINVKSFHKHCAFPNEKYRTVAYSDDGIIEAMEYSGDVFNIGVQWHPEKMLDDEDELKLLCAFIDAAKLRMNSK